MALTVNHGAAVTSGLFTGVTSLQLLALNPRNADMAAMGYTDLGDEPQYYRQDNENNPYTLVRLYLLAPATAGRPAVLATVTFFLYHRQVSMLLNRYGRFGRETPEDIETLGGNDAVWYAYQGEIDMLKFLEKVFDVRKGDDFFFADREKLFGEGDDTELRASAANAIAKSNQFKGCLGIRNGTHQVVFPTVTNKFATDYQPMWKEMLRNQQYLTDYFGPVTFERYQREQFYMREFTGNDEVLVVAPDAPKPAASAAPIITHRPPVVSTPKPAPAPAATTTPQDDDNDLPF